MTPSDVERIKANNRERYAGPGDGITDRPRDPYEGVRANPAFEMPKTPRPSPLTETASLHQHIRERLADLDTATFALAEARETYGSAFATVQKAQARYDQVSGAVGQLLEEFRHVPAAPGAAGGTPKEMS